MTFPFRKPLIVGNWKMQVTVRAATAVVREVLEHVVPLQEREVVIAPPFTALLPVGESIRGTPLRLAAQDLFWEDEGPYTGEISGPMLAELGVTYVLVGHSERRQYAGETDRTVNQKIRAAFRSGLHPILCVGEAELQRASGAYESVVRDQLVRGLEGIPREEAAGLTVAYEPVWAIGTGRAATPADAAEMHAFLRVEIEALYPDVARQVRILYGGSVTESNVDALMARPEVDGVLVGGASLRPQAFARIAGFVAPA